MELTSGCLLDIVNGKPPGNPIVQIANIKRITTKADEHRFRILVSDGNHSYSRVILSVNLNVCVGEKALHLFTVVKMKQYACHKYDNKQIVIIQDLEVLTNSFTELIGNPSQITSVSSKISRILPNGTKRQLFNHHKNHKRMKESSPIPTVELSQLSSYNPVTAASSSFAMESQFVEISSLLCSHKSKSTHLVNPIQYVKNKPLSPTPHTSQHDDTIISHTNMLCSSTLLTSTQPQGTHNTDSSTSLTVNNKSVSKTPEKQPPDRTTNPNTIDYVGLHTSGLTSADITANKKRSGKHKPKQTLPRRSTSKQNTPDKFTQSKMHQYVQDVSTLDSSNQSTPTKEARPFTDTLTQSLPSSIYLYGLNKKRKLLASLQSVSNQYNLPSTPALSVVPSAPVTNSPHDQQSNIRVACIENSESAQLYWNDASNYHVSDTEDQQLELQSLVTELSHTSTCDEPLVSTQMDLFDDDLPSTGGLHPNHSRMYEDSQGFAPDLEPLTSTQIDMFDDQDNCLQSSHLLKTNLSQVCHNSEGFVPNPVTLTSATNMMTDVTDMRLPAEQDTEVTSQDLTFDYVNQGLKRTPSNKDITSSISSKDMTSTPPNQDVNFIHEGQHMTLTSQRRAVLPIDALSPWSERWRIKAKVVRRSGVREYSNSRGHGRLFDVILQDDSGEIRLVAFNQEVDTYYEGLQLHKCYFVSKCHVKTVSTMFPNYKNIYEMAMSPRTKIELCDDNCGTKRDNAEIVKLADLYRYKEHSYVDVIGIIKHIHEATPVKHKQSQGIIKHTRQATQVKHTQSQETLKKRDVTLVDQTGVCVTLTLWGEDANGFKGQGCDIVSVNNAVVKDFSGKSLSTSSSSYVQINPNFKPAHALRQWWDNGGKHLEHINSNDIVNSSAPDLSTNWTTFHQAESAQLGSTHAPAVYTVKASVLYFQRDTVMYRACTTCCTKVTMTTGGVTYHCARCGPDTVTFEWRYSLKVHLSDHSGSAWVTCFDDTAEVMLGVKAEVMARMREEEEGRYEQVMTQLFFKQLVFRIKVVTLTYNHHPQLTSICTHVASVPWREYGARLVGRMGLMGVDMRPFLT